MLSRRWLPSFRRGRPPGEPVTTTPAQPTWFEFVVRDHLDGTDAEEVPVEIRREATLLAASRLDLVVGSLHVVPLFAGDAADAEEAEARRVAEALFTPDWPTRGKVSKMPTRDLPQAATLVPHLLLSAHQCWIEVDEDGSIRYRAWGDWYGETVTFGVRRDELDVVEQLMAEHPGWYILRPD